MKRYSGGKNQLKQSSQVPATAGLTEPLAYAVYALNPSLSEGDYMVFANYYEAQSYACGEGIDDLEIVPLYAKE